MIRELNDRTRQILKLVVDTYIETGAPVGSVLLSQKSALNLSPATIRHVMAELEERGLLYAPHTSAGRLPTDMGMTVFVDGLLELDRPSPEDQNLIDQQIKSAPGGALPGLMEKTSAILSGLSSCAGLVFAPSSNDALRQIEFVLLSPGRAIAVLVGTSGMVENRLIDIPIEVSSATLTRAANYLNARLGDRQLQDALDAIRLELSRDQNLLDSLTARVVEAGIASVAPAPSGGHLFIRGQSNLLSDISALEDLERIRELMETLEAKETMLKVLQATGHGEGVKIFIGAENALFSHAGCSLVIAPYKNKNAQIVGAIGVIGPTRLNYRRIIPVVNYTSQLMQEILP